MDRRGGVGRPRMFDEAPALFGDAPFGSEDRLRRCRAQTNDDRWADQRDLSLQPGAACLQFSAIRFLMNSTLAAFFEFEVFDGIRNLDTQPVDACIAQGPIEQAASRADEGLSLTVLLVARLLADEHDGRRLRTFAEDGLCSVFVKIASPARLNSLAQLRQRFKTECAFEGFLPLHDVLR
jgi:hypothetical protein